MTRRIAVVNDPSVEKKLLFFCPGCKHGHCVEIPRWSWNGSFENPTFSPSVLVSSSADWQENRCHSFVTDGKIQFLSDCFHSLAGQTVELPSLDWSDDTDELFFGEPSERVEEDQASGS